MGGRAGEAPAAPACTGVYRRHRRVPAAPACTGVYRRHRRVPAAPTCTGGTGVYRRHRRHLRGTVQGPWREEFRTRPGDRAPRWRAVPPGGKPQRGTPGGKPQRGTPGASRRAGKARKGSQAAGPPAVPRDARGARGMHGGARDARGGAGCTRVGGHVLGLPRAAFGTAIGSGIAKKGIDSANGSGQVHAIGSRIAKKGIDSANGVLEAPPWQKGYAAARRRGRQVAAGPRGRRAPGCPITRAAPSPGLPHHPGCAATPGRTITPRCAWP
jgi:hypothetical protein